MAKAEKPTIYATGNLTKVAKTSVSYYIIEKNKNFFKWLKRILQGIGLDREIEFKEIEGENGDWIIWQKDVMKMLDVHEKYETKHTRVDLFYGKDRIYLTLSGSTEEREEFAKRIIETTEWVKVEEVKTPAWMHKVKDNKQ